MTDRSWTLDERLHAFRLDDFTTEERALAWKIAECYPAFCRLNRSNPWTQSADTTIVRSRRQHPHRTRDWRGETLSDHERQDTPLEGRIGETIMGISYGLHNFHLQYRP
jgi:hypothetical protein